MYTNIEFSRCTPETNLLLYIGYTSVFFLKQALLPDCWCTWLRNVEWGCIACRFVGAGAIKGKNGGNASDDADRFVTYNHWNLR